MLDAAAVNFPDVLLVAGDYQIAVPPPFVPGSELAGEVVEVADDVTSLHVGDRVFGSTLVGAFAEEAAVAATALTPIPDGVDTTVAAAFGVAHRTAYHVLRSVAQLQSGEELIVLGAGGGVGLAAVQLGTVLGADGDGRRVIVGEARTQLCVRRGSDARSLAVDDVRAACASSSPMVPTSW